MKYSGIGGQAVMEGVMMKNGTRYAVAVRTPDGSIAVDTKEYRGILDGAFKKVPFVRGVLNFGDSMVLGMKSLMYSASFFEEEEKEAEGSSRESAGLREPDAKEKAFIWMMMAASIAAAVVIFMLIPYAISALLERWIPSQAVRAVLEGCLRMAVFFTYILLISRMEDIQRVFMYHGAEHKCINCIERGRPLTVSNVMRSSRLHRRCGTSFIFFVFFVSIVLFFFIRVENPAMRVVIRILLMPVVAGISYEIIRLAGRSDNILVRIISAPGMAIQRMTTKEPDESMVEVAIAAVESVFDWKGYLSEHFGYEAKDFQTEATEE